jgi:large subunit ribosomal protein L29
MKMKDMQLLSAQEMAKKLDEARNELMNLRFQVVTGQLTDTSRFKQVRRDIARYETLLTQRVKASLEGES